MNPKVKNILQDVLLVLLLLAFPTVVGVAVFLISGEIYYLEVIYVLFGLLELLIMMLRFRRRDSNNVRKNHTVYEDTKTSEYKKFKYEQVLLGICGVATLLASLLAFLLGN